MSIIFDPILGEIRSQDTTPSGVGDGFNRISAGTQLAGTMNTINFANSNGITFGMSNSSQITASHNGLTQQSTQPVALSGSNGSFQFSTATFGNLNGLSFYTSGGSFVGSYTVPTQTEYLFSNSNGVSFGTNGSTVTATVKTDYLTQQSTQPVAISGSNGSFSFSTATFGNMNGMSFYTSNGSMVGSYTVPIITNSSLTIQAGASTLSSVSRVHFGDSNGISFGASTSNNGSITITASHDGLTSQSNQAISGSNGSFTFQTATFGNLNGLSFYTSNGSVVGSYTVPTQSVQPVAASGSNGSFNFSTLTFGNLNGLSFYTSNGSLVGSYTNGGGVAVAAGTQTATSGTALFNNANGITFGMSNSSVITASHNGLTTAAQSDHSHGNPTLNLTNLSGTTASASNGFTLSLSAANPGGGAGVTYKYFRPSRAEWVITAQGQGSYSVQYAALPNLEISRVNFPINFSGATNSTGQYTATILMGLYSKNVSTLSAAHTFSTAFVWTHSGTANSVSHVGPRILSLPWTTTIGASDYWVGIGYRTTSASANASFSVFALSQINSSISGFMKSASAASVGQFPMEGVYTATTSANPSSIHITQINGISSAMRRQPVFFLGGDS